MLQRDQHVLGAHHVLDDEPERAALRAAPVAVAVTTQLATELLREVLLARERRVVVDVQAVQRVFHLFAVDRNHLADGGLQGGGGGGGRGRGQGDGGEGGGGGGRGGTGGVTCGARRRRQAHVEVDGLKLHESAEITPELHVEV